MDATVALRVSSPTADPSSLFQRLFVPTSLLVLLLLTAWVYWSGLDGPFVFDDYNNIVANPNLHLKEGGLAAFWQAMLAGDAGPLKRPISMLTFAMNYRFGELEPFPYKLTNLGIHLVNGVLVFALCRRLLRLDVAGTARMPAARRDNLALAATGVWLLHPAQLTSVLYVVQRMTSLSASFVLLSLLVYLRAREPVAAGRLPSRLQTTLWFSFPAFVALAALTKENGVLAIMYGCVLEVVFLRFAADPRLRWGTPRQFYALTIVLPLALVALYLFTHPEWLDRAASNRHFNVAERLLTEARVLFLYLEMLVVPSISQMALFYDDFEVSRGFLAPPSTSWAVAAWMLLALAAWLGHKRWPWFSLAVLWYLAGHAIESSIIMLELIHPHRNYIAYLGPILALVVAGNAALSRTRRWLPGVVLLATLAALAVTTELRAHQWRNPLDLAVYEVRHRPASARANYEMGRLLNLAARNTGEQSLNEEALNYLRRAATLAPTEIGALVGVAMVSGGAIPPADFAELKRRLESRPMPPNQVSYLQSLVTCQRQETCKTPPEQISAIFSALLSHPRLRTNVRADAVTILGIYYAEQLRDAPAAIRLMQEAVSLMPQDTARHLNLAQAQAMLPDTNAAAASLRAAERLDFLGGQRGRIEQIRRDLAQRDAQAEREARKTAAP